MSGRVLSALRRAPFTLALAAAIVAVTLATSGPGLTARPEVIDRWGWALHDLWDGAWWSLVTAVFLNHRPYLVAVTVAFVAASAGVLEWVGGTRRALAVFWGGDLAATLAISLGLVLPLYLAGTEVGRTLAYADDVGMSGGGFACLGAWVGRLPQRWRRLAIATVVVYLAVDLGSVGDLEADLLHAVAFPVGMLLDRALTRRRRAEPTRA